jgi:hypothetical protein
MEIRYSDGRTATVDTEAEARRILDAEYPDAEYGEWESDGQDAAGRDRSRMLVWSDAETAGDAGTGDDGSHACAEIVRS